MEPMTLAEIAALNDLIDEAYAQDNQDGLGITTYDVCLDAGLDEVSTHDGSGTLFRDPRTGRHCFAWENGHVDDQISAATE